MREMARGRLPLFVRIFALMMATLLLVQLLNLALLIVVPPPRPTIGTLTNITAALHGRPPADKSLIVATAKAPVEDSARFPARRMRAQLARQLGLALADVHVRAEDWPGSALFGSPNFAGPGPRPSFEGPRDGPPPQDRPPFEGGAPGQGGPPGQGAPPGQIGPPGSAGPPAQGGPPAMDGPPREFDMIGPAVLFGDFSVSAKINGQWRTVHAYRSEISPWRWRAFAWLIVAMIVVAPFAWLLSRALARPIGLFAQAAERLGRDPRAPPLELAGPREIAHAAVAFNGMQARLNRYVEDRTTLMAAIAHDLRTPLMRLGLRLEHAPTDLRESCEQDIGEMEQMIAAVMGFARDMQPRDRRRLDLRSLAQSVTDDFVDMGGSVALEDGEPIIFQGDAPALKSLLSNLIGNAVKYAGGATVRLSAEAGRALIEVSDTGPGMSDDDLVRAFEPFFRAERSRNRDTGGIGLGLASVRAVARAHGGEATLANRPEGGLVARIALPM